jgi:hypothetical protein
MLRLTLRRPLLALHRGHRAPCSRPLVAIYSTSSSSSPPSSLLPPMASQDNGFARSRTIYRGSPEQHKFQVEKTGGAMGLLGQKADGLRLRQAPSKLAAIRRTGSWIYDVLWDLFLPKDARASLTKDYFPYAQWSFVGSVASCAASVLSMQSLLYAIGLGAGAIPTTLIPSGGV